MPQSKTGRTMTGAVIFFDATKGYGYISPDCEGPDVFVHHSDIKMAGYRRLEPGQRVQFELVDVGRGPKAEHVRLIGHDGTGAGPKDLQIANDVLSGAGRETSPVTTPLRNWGAGKGPDFPEKERA